MLLENPLRRALSNARSVLLAGMGGGFDILHGLPLYFALKWEGKDVHLANLSFSDLSLDAGSRLAPALVEVEATSRVTNPYFPELFLSRWFREHEGERVPIYCFERVGVGPLREAYLRLKELLGFDAIVLVDGGTDSLMRGDEEGLGTPHEDIASLLAVDALEAPVKLVCAVGFGVDRHHGVSHALVLDAVAELARAGGYLGSFSLLREMPEVGKLRSAASALFQAMPGKESIVASSILSAIDGDFGDYHTTARTEDSTLWINPLMAMYWCFRLSPMAARVLYRDQLLATETFEDIDRAIRIFRSSLQQPRREYPIPL